MERPAGRPLTGPWWALAYLMEWMDEVYEYQDANLFKPSSSYLYDKLCVAIYWTYVYSDSQAIPLRDAWAVLNQYSLLALSTMQRGCNIYIQVWDTWREVYSKRCWDQIHTGMTIHKHYWTSLHEEYIIYLLTTYYFCTTTQMRHCNFMLQ